MLRRRGSARRTARFKVPLVALSAVAAVMCAGASSAIGSSSSTSALPARIEVPAVISLSGAAGLPGGQVADGMKFAAAEINRTKFLGRSKLILSLQDDQTNTERAHRLVTDAVNSKAPALLGPAVSSLALATAPVAQEGELAYIASQAQVSALKPLLQRGSWIFRLTSPQLNYQDVTVNYLKRKGIKSTTLLYVQEGAAQTEWATKVLPPLLRKAGIEIKDTIAFPQTQTDFSALATRLRQSDPDSIGMATFSSQNPAIFTQLRLGGYRGLLYGDNSFGGNSLQGAGAHANGAVWAADFAPFMTNPSSRKFTKAWRAAKKTDPLNFNAEGYDAVWFLARALKSANTLNRAKVRDAMEAITKVGMTGAVGKIVFKRTHDAYVDGVLLQWVNGGVVPAR
jgi:branched-chain amino acid transport system substrate-binding protein